MIGAALTVAFALGFVAPGPAPDPSALVGQLGSARYPDRERAAANLMRLGKVAMPALRAAKSAKDLEIRTRATAILGRIEGSLLVESTPIDLDFRDVKIADVLRTINARTGLSLTAASDGDPGWAERRFSLDPGTSLPFWKAIDTLCEAGQAHYVLGGPKSLGQGASAFSIEEGIEPPLGPISDAGPFRVQLAGVHHLSEVQLSQPRPGMAPLRVVIGPPRGTAPASRQFYLQLLVASEPQLAIAQNGPVRVTEAFDEEGRSMTSPARPGGIQHSSGYFGMNPSPLLRLRVDLARLEGAGRRIKRVRGTIPVAVATRKPDPMVIPLDRPPGQTSRDDEVALTVRDVKPGREGGPATIELTIRNAGRTVTQAELFEGDVVPYRPESPQQQIEIFDAQGRPLPWFPKGSLYNGEETRLTMTVLPVEGSGPPASLRHHGMIRGSTEIPFEFRDIPMP